jgi:two-component system cell cycle sensor histidine kinase/response regulator CckA
VEYRTNGVEALEAFRHQPKDRPFNLVITDMTMPHMTGAELARELSRLELSAPVLLCTGFSEGINEDMARSIGICAFLMKPVIMGELAGIIRKVLDEKTK